MSLLSKNLRFILKIAADNLRDCEKIIDSIQWQVGTLVQAEWDAKKDDFKAEGITFERYCQEVAQAFNATLKSHVKSGATIRRWSNVCKHYADKPDLLKYKDIVPFNGYFEARRMHKEYGTEYELFFEYITEGHAVDQAVAFFTPEEDVMTLVQKITSWFGSLPRVQWKSVKDEKRAQELQDELKMLMERQL